MDTDIAEVHVQDLAAEIETAFSMTRVDAAFRRFGVGDEFDPTASDPILQSLRNLSETDSFGAVVAYLLDEGEWTAEQRSALQDAVSGSPLVVREADDGSLDLYKRVRGVADRSVGNKREYLESAVSDTTRIQIETAERNLANGEYDLAAAEMRRALDELVVAGYDEGLEELAEEGLIRIGDEHEHSDATLLYVAYGYLSFLGADPEVKGFETSKLQAEMALVLAQEVLYFILETISEAEDRGIELRYWERV